MPLLLDLVMSDDDERQMASETFAALFNEALGSLYHLAEYHPNQIGPRCSLYLKKHEQESLVGELLEHIPMSVREIIGRAPQLEVEKLLALNSTDDCCVDTSWGVYLALGQQQAAEPNEANQVIYVGQSRAITGGLRKRTWSHNSPSYRASQPNKLLYRLIEEEPLEFVVLYKIPRTKPVDTFCITIVEMLFVLLFGCFGDSGRYTSHLQALPPYGVVRMPPSVVGANVSSPFMEDGNKVNLTPQEVAELVKIQEQRSVERHKLWAETPKGIASMRAIRKRTNEKQKEARKAKREELGRTGGGRWTKEETTRLISLVQEEMRNGKYHMKNKADVPKAVFNQFPTRSIQSVISKWLRSENEATKKGQSLRPASEKKAKFACSFKGCTKSYVWKKGLQEHEKKHEKTHETEPLRCEFHGCTRSYQNKGSLVRHMKTHRQGSQIAPVADSDATDTNSDNGDTTDRDDDETMMEVGDSDDSDSDDMDSDG